MKREDTPRGNNSRAPGSTRLPWLLVALLILGAMAASVRPASAIGCLTQEMNQRFVGDRTPLHDAVRTHQPGHPMAPPENPQVGDAWQWYLWYFVGGPPHYILTTCTVRGVGQNVYVVVEDASWGTYVDQADVDQIVANWDNTSYGPWPDKGIHQLNTETFGPVPDALDNDPRVYVVLYNWDTSLADGYWNVGDQFPDSPSNPSNECECLYVDASTADPGGPGGPYLTAVMSHEFEHMLHWYQDNNESAWVDEGLAELAMWLYGRPDNIIGFPSAPDNCLTDFTGTTANYIKCYLFALYFFEHFGGTQAILNLVANPLNSYFGVESTMAAMGYTTTFAQLVADWTTANFLDNPSLEGGRYNYEGATIPTFASVTKSTYPVPPTNATIDNLAADYVKFINGQPQQLTFDGTDTSNWHIRVVKYLAGTPLSVEDMPLDAAQAGGSYLFNFGSDYDQVVMVVTNTKLGGPLPPVSYLYGTLGIPASVDPLAVWAEGMRLEVRGANPSNRGASLRLVLDRPAEVTASVYDTQGRLVAPLLTGGSSAGTYELVWNGRDKAGQLAPGGVYFVRAQAAGVGLASQRVTLLR